MKFKVSNIYTNRPYFPIMYSALVKSERFKDLEPPPLRDKFEPTKFCYKCNGERALEDFRYIGKLNKYSDICRRCEKELK